DIDGVPGGVMGGEVGGGIADAKERPDEEKIDQAEGGYGLGLKGTGIGGGGRGEGDIGLAEDKSGKDHEPYKKMPMGSRSTPIKMRSEFGALAFYVGSLPPDARGRATVTVKLPDTLTRYRVMAVALSGEKQFGAGESTITAKLPLMVRPSPPRFL